VENEVYLGTGVIYGRKSFISLTPGFDSTKNFTLVIRTVAQLVPYLEKALNLTLKTLQLTTLRLKVRSKISLQYLRQMLQNIFGASFCFSVIS
jgi:hypothetical protein